MNWNQRPKATGTEPPSQTPEKTPVWLIALGATTVVIVAISLTFSALGSWDQFVEFLKVSGPSWVQAVGSIVAIWVAFEVMKREANEQRARDAETSRQHRLNRLEVCLAIFRRGESVCTVCAQFLSSRPPAGSTKLADILSEAISMFGHMPLLEVPAPFLVRRLPVLQMRLTGLREKVVVVLNHAESDWDHPDSDWALEDAFEDAGDVAKLFVAAVSHCDELMLSCMTPDELAARPAAMTTYKQHLERARRPKNSEPSQQSH